MPVQDLISMLLAGQPKKKNMLEALAEQGQGGQIEMMRQQDPLRRRSSIPEIPRREPVRLLREAKNLETGETFNMGDSILKIVSGGKYWIENGKVANDNYNPLAPEPFGFDSAEDMVRWLDRLKAGGN